MNKYKRFIFLVIALLVLTIASYFLFTQFDFKGAKRILSIAGFILAVILVYIAVVIIVDYQNKQKIRNLENRLAMWAKLSYHISEVGDEVFNDLPVGVIVFDENQEIKWSNPFSSTIWQTKLVGKGLKELDENLETAVSSNSHSFRISHGNKYYDCIYRKENQAVYLFDVSEKEELNIRYIDRMPSIGFINLDNLDEALMSLDVSEQSSIKGAYLGAIDDWISHFHGFLKPFSEERLFILVSKVELEKMMIDRFRILDNIRAISEKNNVKVSLSIGIACWDVSLEELGGYAQNAIELAEKRGGDQAVINIENRKIAYFGAKTDAVAKSSRVSARINAQILKEQIEKSSNVFVIGHINTDLDSFGSMIAALKIALSYNSHSFMVIDEGGLDSTVLPVFQEYLIKFPTVEKNYISTEEVLTIVDENSLLIILDTPTPKIISSPDVLDKINRVIVIDHHRSSEEGFKTVMSYIEPYSSSTVELLIELIDFLPISPTIYPYEATVMYGGLVVDTNNFTYKTGARTFEGAAKLKEWGAETATVKRWLRRDLERTNNINALLLNVDVFLDIFAIVKSDLPVEDSVLLAQVSEELMQIKGIEAAFTIGKIPNGRIGISARSYQDINVQVIMEDFGGGGHLNSAAAQVKDSTVLAVYQKLKSQLELEYSGGGELMKVILLEDVKGRGIMDDVIEVASGYGQFLINSKKAILATDDNLAKLAVKFEKKKDEIEHQLKMMREIRDEISNKSVDVGINIGPDGKLFGSVTVKNIVDAFYEQHGVLLDRRKIDLTSEINSLGIYTAIVNLHPEVKAQIEINVIEK